jgi:hypothetical protein
MSIKKNCLLGVRQIRIVRPDGCGHKKVFQSSRVVDFNKMKQHARRDSSCMGWDGIIYFLPSIQPAPPMCESAFDLRSGIPCCKAPCNDAWKYLSTSIREMQGRR